MRTRKLRPTTWFAILAVTVAAGGFIPQSRASVARLSITNQPRSQFALVGQPVRLTVVLSGPGPFHYQWQFNGTNISGATSNTLVIAHAAMADSGAYGVVVGNALESLRSLDAIVSVRNEGVYFWGNNLTEMTNGTLGLTNVIAVAVGLRHGLALQADGRVFAWGGNFYGQTNLPPNLTNVVAIAAGNSHSLALRADGRVVAWGDNEAGQASVPLDLDHVVAIAAGTLHSLALKSDGTVVAWGSDSVNVGGETNVPAGLTNVVAITASSSYSLALRADGAVAAWGGASAAQFKVTNVVAVAPGLSHILGLRANGTLAAWGDIIFAAATVPADATNVIAITAGWYHNLALKADGSLLAWGTDITNVFPFPRAPNHSYGQSVVPSWLTNVTAIGAGYYQNIVVVGGGRPFVTGPLVNRLSIFGQTLNVRVAAQGAGPLSYQWMFDGTSLPGATNATLVLTNIQFSQAGSYSVRVSNAFGEVVSSGMMLTVAPLVITAQPQSQATFLGATVRLGVAASGPGPMRYQWRINGTNLIGATNSSMLLTNLRTEQTGWYSVVISNPVGFESSADAFVSVGEVFAWGSNNEFGQTNLPFGLTNVVALSAGSFHSMASRADGTVVAWGNNQYGQTNVPKLLTNVFATAAGERHSLALKTDGTVTVWGENQFGQTNVPPKTTNIVAITAGAWHSLALKENGTVAAWGANDSGQTQVPNGLSNVIAVAAGIPHSVALKADQTVVVWGDDGWGESNVPVGLSNVVAISAGWQHTVALKSDGTVAVWGAGYAGQTNLPAGLTNVIAISAGGHHTLAMRTDRTLITWGDTSGNLQVPTVVTNVRAFAAGGGHNLVLLGNAPSILAQPLGVRVTIGSNATFAVTATSVPAPSYQWLKDGFAISAATSSILNLTSIDDSAAGSYSVAVSNSFGATTSTNAVLAVNHLPVPDAGATVSEALSSDNLGARVILDASRSYDRDGDKLLYVWSSTDTGSLLATGMVTAVSLPMGTNYITLTVSDGLAAGGERIFIQILNAQQALERLIDLISIKAGKPQPFIATLSAALASINRGNSAAAVGQLHAFVNKIDSQVASLDPLLGETLVQRSEAIADILDVNPAANWPIRILSIHRHPREIVKLKFSGPHCRPYIIQASTNLLDWEAVGSAVGSCQTECEFDDASTAGTPQRFYRIVRP